MIPVGQFDPTIVPAGWFDPTAIAIGFFSRDLVNAATPVPPFVPPTYIGEFDALTWLPNLFTGPAPG